MTGICDQSVLEMCAAEFEREHLTPPREGDLHLGDGPRRDGTPLPEEQREWGRIWFSGFRAWKDYDDGRTGWSGQIVGNRSDGQHFYVNVSLPLEFSSDRSLGDPVEYVRTKLVQALLQFHSYRDCSCGIAGYEQTGEVDGDGDPIERPVMSPCRWHPKRDVILDEEEVTA